MLNNKFEVVLTNFNSYYRRLYFMYKVEIENSIYSSNLSIIRTEDDCVKTFILKDFRLSFLTHHSISFRFY